MDQNVNLCKSRDFIILLLLLTAVSGWWEEAFFVLLRFTDVVAGVFLQNESKTPRHKKDYKSLFWDTGCILWSGTKPAMSLGYPCNTQKNKFKAWMDIFLVSNISEFQKCCPEYFCAFTFGHRTKSRKRCRCKGVWILSFDKYCQSTFEEEWIQMFSNSSIPIPARASKPESPKQFI